MAWLRGWATTDRVRAEFRSMANVSRTSTTNLNDCSSETIAKATDASTREKKRDFKDIFSSYTKRQFYMPLASVCYMFVVHALGGSMATMVYSILIFRMIGSPIEKRMAAVIFDALRIIGAVTCVLIIHRTGKRKLMFVSLIGTGFSYLTISSFAFLMRGGQLPLTEGYLWTPTVMLMVAAFLASIGMDKVVYMLNVELFPTQYRNVGVGIGLFVTSVFNSIMNKTFLYMVELMSIQGVFLFFSCANLIGFATFYYIFPETNGKSLKEIEDHYVNIKKSKKESTAYKISMDSAIDK